MLDDGQCQMALPQQENSSYLPGGCREGCSNPQLPLQMEVPPIPCSSPQQFPLPTRALLVVGSIPAGGTSLAPHPMDPSCLSLPGCPCLCKQQSTARASPCASAHLEHLRGQHGAFPLPAPRQKLWAAGTSQKSSPAPSPRRCTNSAATSRCQGTAGSRLCVCLGSRPCINNSP